MLFAVSRTHIIDEATKTVGDDEPTPSDSFADPCYTLDGAASSCCSWNGVISIPPNADCFFVACTKQVVDDHLHALDLGRHAHMIWNMWW